jgi:hypothetical protein
MQVQRGSGGVFRLEPSRFISEIDPQNYEAASPRRSW